MVELLKQAVAAPIVSIDLETSALRPYGGGVILTIALSFGDVNFSFPWKHPKAEFLSTKLRPIMLDLLSGAAIKVAHNAPFECEWFISEFGPDVIVHDSWEDTMMQAHFLDERRGGLSLDFLIKQHFGTAYKSLFNLNKKDMAKSDLNETLIYNAVDTKYTLRLWHHQNKLLKEQGVYEAYKLARARQPTVALMQHLGLDVDTAAVAHFQRHTGAEIDNLQKEIASLEVVQKYVRERGEFNPLGDDAVSIFRDYLKRKEIEVYEEGQQLRWSVDKHVLDKIDHPLARLIVELRHITKLKSTYVDILDPRIEGSIIFPDNKIHTNFNTCFTETGRTSSDQPNMQNFPQRKDNWVRQQFIPPPNHYIVACDYGQLEVCTAAMLSRDKYLVNCLWNDVDLHMDWAGRLAKIYPKVCPNFSDPAEAKKLRGAVKGGLVFASLYGAGEKKIASSLGVPVEIASKLLELFWKELSGLAKWQADLMKNYYAKGYVLTPFGRKRRYPLSREQAVNYPLQCTASDIVCDAMVRLSKLALETDRMFLHPRLNIHDDLTFCLPSEGLDESIEIIYRVMLTPPWPDLVNVPLSVKIEIGKNWGELHEVGKFWSHKDL